MKESPNDILTKIPLFRALASQELTDMSKFIEIASVKKDKTLFEEGAAGDSVCFVIDGRLDVYKKTFTGNDFIINTLSRGQSFGDMSLLENTARSATVKAGSETTYVTLSRDNFERILEEYPRIGNKILKGLCILLSKKIRTTTSRLIDYMSKHP
jgi:CRP/FNR family transcriptional regulator, cyclic AMP receptor protein